MHRAASFLVTLALLSSIVAGCGCLAADSYEKAECRKYWTDWSYR
jgi:hypothetical protein